MSLGGANLSLSAAAPSSTATPIPVHVRLGDVCLLLTTTSRCADAAPVLGRSESGLSLCTRGASLTRRSSREASLEAFCFVAENEGSGVGWYYAPLEDYDRKKLRVDEGVVKWSIVERGVAGTTTRCVRASPESGKKPVGVFYRIPDCTTFRQLSLADDASATPPSDSTTGGLLDTASKSALMSTRVFSEQPERESEAQTQAEGGSEGSGRKGGRVSVPLDAESVLSGSDDGTGSPPLLAQLFSSARPRCQDSDSLRGSSPRSDPAEHGALEDERGSSCCNSEEPQPVCLLSAPRYPDSESAITPASSIRGGGLGGLALPLSISLQELEESEEDRQSRWGGGEGETPVGLHTALHGPLTATTSSSTSSNVPRCPPKLSAAMKANGRRRQQQHQQALAVAASRTTDPRDPAACTSPTRLSTKPNGTHSPIQSSSYAGLTERSLEGSSTDPNSSRRNSTNFMRSNSDLARAAAPEMTFTVSRFTPAPPPPLRQSASDAAHCASAQDDISARPSHPPAADGRAKRLSLTPNRPTVRRSTLFTSVFQQ